MALQAWVRGYFARKVYKKLWDHKRGLLCVQRNVRMYMVGKKWLWWQLLLAIKPKLKSGNLDGFRQELAERIRHAQDNLGDVVRQREAAEKKNADLSREVDEIRTTAAGGTNAKQDLADRIARVHEAESALAKEIANYEQRTASEEAAMESLRQQMKKVDATQDQLTRDMRDSEGRLSRVQEEKVDKDNQVRQLREELQHQEDLVAKLSRDKKGLAESNLKDEEVIQTMEDRCNHLSKLKLRLEKQLDEVEDSLEREKKHKSDVEKTKRQVRLNYVDAPENLH